MQAGGHRPCRFSHSRTKLGWKESVLDGFLVVHGEGRRSGQLRAQLVPRKRQRGQQVSSVTLAFPSGSFRAM